MGNVLGVVLGVGNRPRQGRAVLEILALLYLLRKLDLGQARDYNGSGGHTTMERGMVLLSPDQSLSLERQSSDHSQPDSASSSSHSSTSGRSQTQAQGATATGSRRPSIISNASTTGGAPLSRLAALNARLRAYQPLQLILGVLIGVHIANNLSLLLGLNAPHHSLVSEPDMHYSKNFSSVRWLLTGLDAATLSTLKVKIPFFRHALTLILSVYYLANRIAADNKVNAFRRTMTPEAVKACWEKGTTPLLAAVDRVMRQRSLVDLELLEITSPDGHKIECRLFYNKPRGQLQNETRLVLDLPGGGFIAMSPQHHADYLSYWSQILGVPILSVNYRKAPQFPFPCGFEDAWYVYKAIIDSNGAAAGINCGESTTTAPIRLAVVGDSAGGNLSAGITVKAILSQLRVPDGVHMIYPVLDFAGEIWRTTSLPPKDLVVKAREFTKKKTPPTAAASPSAMEPCQEHRPADARECDPSAAHKQVDPSASDPYTSTVVAVPSSASAIGSATPSAAFPVNPSPPTDRFGLPQLSSRTLYAYDGVLPLKYMLLLADSYFKNGGDPVNNPFASPMAASDEVLRSFPPIYSHVGSVDPLVDDVIKFARRVQVARPDSDVFLCVIPKISHAYLHVAQFLPEAKLSIDLSAVWLAKILDVEPPKNLNLDERMKELQIKVTNLKDQHANYMLDRDHEAPRKSVTKATAPIATEEKPLTSKL